MAFIRPTFCLLLVISGTGCEQRCLVLPITAKRESTIASSPARGSLRTDRATCLPIPDSNDILHVDELLSVGPIKAGDFSIDPVYLYLVAHLDSLEPKKILESDPFWGPIEWTQSFRGKIRYHHIIYAEVGKGFDLFTRCDDKSEFLRVIEPLIRINYQPDGYWEEPFEWNSDSSRYGQPHNTSGNCIYYINRDSSGCYSLSWHCGC